MIAPSDGHFETLSRGRSDIDQSNLARAQESGRLSFHAIDIRAKELRDVFEAEAPQVVMHLAAQIDVRVSVADPILDGDVNILGTLNVLERARVREAGVSKVVVASSGGCVYGDARVLPIKESARGRPESPYGISKRVLHDYLAFYSLVHGLKRAVMALSNVYGPRQDPHGEAGVVAIVLRTERGSGGVGSALEGSDGILKRGKTSVSGRERWSRVFP